MDGYIDNFFGEYRWLSNFWPVKVSVYGEEYPSVEHAYQAAKSLDAEVRKSIQKCPAPKDAKKIGRLIEIRKDWEQVKIKIMYYLLKQKFSDVILKQKLIDTGNKVLVEGNNWDDHFWGICNGSGKNILGRLLMMIRNNILKEKLNGFKRKS